MEFHSLHYVHAISAWMAAVLLACCPFNPTTDGQAAEERQEAAEARSRGLYEASQRLEAHVHDLESRKRAPLYQKKQEVRSCI